MTSLARLSLSIALFAFLSSCASVRSVGDNQAAERAAESAPPIPDQWTSARERVGDVQVGWIAAFEDPVLEELVEEALTNNRNLQAAEAAVRRSWALARQAGAQQYPFLDVSAGVTRQDPIEGLGRSTTYSAAAAVSYEIDIWSRIAAGEAAAVASAEAAAADYTFTQYSIAAAVARSYFLAIEAQEQVEVAQSIFDALSELEKAQELFDAEAEAAKDPGAAESPDA